MWRILLMVCLLGPLPGVGAQATEPTDGPVDGRRLALVIGNDSYPDAPLGNPASDARAMSQTLRALGFDVMTYQNATRPDMLQAIRQFEQRLAAGGVGLFYFAGHGLRVGERTLLLPVDVDGRQPARQLADGIDLDRVLGGMAAGRPGKLNLVVLDTCQNNPFRTGVAATPAVPGQTLIAQATAPGQLAADGARHGLYTAALLDAMVEPGADLMAVFARAQAAVWRASQHQQLPALSASASVNTAFTFRPAGHRLAQPLLQLAAAEPDRPAATQHGAPYRGILPKDGEEQYELAFWESIKNSSFASDYEAYLEAYPKGRFAGLARARIERLRAAAAKSEAPPAPKAAPAPPPRRAQPAPPPAARPAPAPAPVAAPARPTPAARTAIAEVKDCPTCPALITVPRGSFTMGSNSADPSEKPAHRVAINAPFAIGKFEVTAEQWTACVTAEACPRIATVAGSPANAPARDISWNDAQQFVKWLSKLSGQAYRLPTEAEWEYAARGGTDSRHWWGDKMQAGQANCAGCGDPWQQLAPAPVGSFAANPYGLHDTSGSVWEWVSDCWHSSYRGAPANGQAWDEPNCTVRVIRGGSWRDGTGYMLSSTRFKYDASVRNAQNGFRVARDIK
jgi:formylglycine-generating enzyme required for sulfatase activity